eukprot:7215567-Alexandrium_andersonii.AAC.1
MESWLGAILNFLGWVVFGGYWQGVKTAGARLAGVAVLLIFSAGIHYMAMAFGPLLSVLCFFGNAALW